MSETAAVLLSDVEEYALAVALASPAAARYLLNVAHLEPEDFCLPSQQALFREVAAVVAEGKDPDPLILTERLRGREWFEQAGGPAWLHTLIALPALVTRTATYAEIVREHARRRRTKEIGARLAAGKLEAAEAVAELALLTEAGPEAAEEPFVQWQAFWTRDWSDAEWTVDDVLARGRGHAFYAGRKEGKSLFMLYTITKLATEKAGFVCIYLDYEMTLTDVYDRLVDMGYGPDSDLSSLHYALLPMLPPLDTAAGAAALMRLVDEVQAARPEHHLVLVIDTISRAVEGEENSADTIRAFYAHTGIELKRRGVTWARLDHGGKDPARGQRGSSGKGDDVDVVWRLERTQNGICLHRELSRMPWVPEKVTFSLTEEPLRFQRLVDDWPAGTKETAEDLDRLAVPTTMSVRAAQQALKDAEMPRRKQVVAAAQRWRRERERGTP